MTIMQKKLLYSLGVSIGLLVLMFTAAKNVSAATLTLTPTSANITLGQTINVDIMLDTQGVAIDGVDIYYLRYNPNILEVVDSNTSNSGIQITPGTLLGQTLGNSATNGSVVFSQISNATASYSGVGKLATIKFKAKAGGTSDITIDFTGVGNPFDSNVASASGDRLTSVGNARITVPGSTTDPTANFSASPSSIVPGQSSTLTWTSNNATSVSINQGIGAVIGSGSRGVSPASTTTYTLTATNSTGVSTTRTATVTVGTATNAIPIGAFDPIAADGIIKGWSIDPDNKTASNQVHIYIGGPAGTSGVTPIGIVTNVLRADVNTANNTTGNHGFTHTIPAQYRDGVAHSVYIYGIDLTDSTRSVLLPGSPRSFTLSGPPSVPTISNIVVSNVTNTAVNISWGTDVAAYSKLRYCTAAFDCTVATTENTTAAATRTLNLSSLTACTVYHYQILARISTEVAVSPRAAFATTGCEGGASIVTYNTQRIARSTGGTLAHQKAKLNIPTNFSTADSDFQIHELNPTTFFGSAGNPSNKLRVQNMAYSLRAYNTSIVSSFASPISVTLGYDSIPSNVDSSTLKIYRYNGTSWSALTNCSHNSSSKEVTCTTTQFSVFSIFGDEEDEPTSGGGGGGSPSPSPSPTPTPTPTPAPAPSVPVDGILIKDPSSPAIYIMEYGKKRPFANWESFVGLGFVGKPMQTITVSSIPTGDGIFTPNQRHTRGTLVLLNGTVYFLGAQLKYGFPSLAVFNSWGRSFSEVVVGNTHDNQMPNGPIVEMR
jgi:hypothetical protein